MDIIEKAREMARDERREILDSETLAWRLNCESCSLIREGLQSGFLKKGTWKDRDNPICKACPTHYELLSYGEKLDAVIIKERSLR